MSESMKKRQNFVDPRNGVGRTLFHWFSSREPLLNCEYLDNTERLYERPFYVIASELGIGSMWSSHRVAAVSDTLTAHCAVW